MFNIQQLMKQAQAMQKKVEDMQNELKNTTIEAQSGGGVINVSVNGKGEFVSIKIKPEAINPENPSSVEADTVEMLEDILTEALLDATNKATTQMESKMKSITGGINIPGLF